MVISGKNMEKTGKSQMNGNKTTVVGRLPQLPWKLPQITLWKVHNLPGVNTMEKQVKCRIGLTRLLKLPQVKYCKYHGRPLVAAPGVKILFSGESRNYLRTTPGNSTIDLRELPEDACGNAVVIYGKLRT